MFFPQQLSAYTVPAAAGSAYAAYALPAASGRHSAQPDLYDLDALLPTGVHAEVLGQVLNAGGPLALTEVEVAVPDGTSSDVLDIALAINAAGADENDPQQPPVLVKYSFALGRLIRTSLSAPTIATTPQVAQPIASARRI